jgi:hypothetical protein
VLIRFVCMLFCVFNQEFFITIFQNKNLQIFFNFKLKVTKALKGYLNTKIFKWTFKNEMLHGVD